MDLPSKPVDELLTTMVVGRGQHRQVSTTTTTTTRSSCARENVASVDGRGGSQLDEQE